MAAVPARPPGLHSLGSVEQPHQLQHSGGRDHVNEIIASVAWIAISCMFVAIIARRMPRQDARYLWYCCLAHMFSAFALIWLTYNFFGGGDIEVYYYYGEALAEHIRNDPGRWGPEIFKLMLQIDAELPMRIFGTPGSSTASTIAMSAFVMLVNAGSEYGTGLAFTLVALSGQVGMYFAFRNHFPPAYRTRFLIAIFLVPSAVFWTSGVVKEAVAIGGMGWMIWGLNKWIVRRERFSSLVWIGVGAVTVAISKAYVLFPMVVGAGIWWFWHHSMATKGSVAIASKPFHIAAGVVLAIGGMFALGEVFPQYSIQELGEEAADLQERGQRAAGGSTYHIGDPTETSLAGQLAFAPMAMFASLFRPLIIEAHHAVAAVNGLEMLVVKVLLIRTLWIRGIRGTWRVLQSSPVLMFCLVFVLLFALGVGLTTTNLGTLSRYRVPMMPMYALVLVMAYPMET